MTDRKPIRVILVDDHIKVHRAIAALVDFLDDVVLIAQGNNGIEAIQLCEQYQPDIVLMDVIMPGMDGIEATRRILEKFPAIKILALSSFQDSDSIRGMMEAGAIGYLLKNASIDDLAATLRAVHTGKMVFSPEVTPILLRKDAETPEGSKDDFGLSPRELEVLKLMIDGLSNKEISVALIMSLSTAKFHVSSILAKLGVDSRVEAVALAIEKHLIN